MKRLFGFIFLIFLATSFALAENSCELSATLVNQDPYPAVPGDYVKLVFQLDGVEDPDCGDITFELLENYPIIFDNSSYHSYSIKAGTFVKDYSSHATIPFKVRIDENAIDENADITVSYSSLGSSRVKQEKVFNISVEDVKADFEIYVRDFDFATNTVTLEILNIAKTNVEAVTIEVLNAEDIELKGPRSRIVGDLDSNEDTNTEFEINPQQSEISLKVLYTDETGARRFTEEIVSFNPSFFEGRKTDQKQTSKTPIVIVLLIIIIAGYFWYKKRKKKKLN